MDAGDNYRVTAMHLAAIGNQLKVAQMLLKARANVRPFDVDGDQPLHWAATKGHVEVGPGRGCPGDGSGPGGQGG